MYGVQLDPGTCLYIWCRNSSLMQCFFLYSQAPSHLHPEVIMDLLYEILDLICILASIMLHLHWFPNELHPWVCSLDLEEWGAVGWFRYPIIPSKVSQWTPMYPIVLLMINEISQVLLYTGIDSFALPIRSEMDCCCHSWINPQTTAQLTPEVQCTLRASVRTNCIG